MLRCMGGHMAMCSQMAAQSVHSGHLHLMNARMGYCR